MKVIVQIKSIHSVKYITKIVITPSSDVLNE